MPVTVAGAAPFWEPHPLSTTTAALRIATGTVRKEDTLKPFFRRSRQAAAECRLDLAMPNGAAGVVTVIRSAGRRDRGVGTDR
ncbi:hypothetical protein GCM10017600_20560 [Streptosporangium carneum]|uniref:Uncharacterized protein n=1 Tax=Streptosporangium carneum TaxID=47481 RepID=A0A9W6MC00_9ACTN|nr:hypothetical protein GCM10017600_20560 [Streptosporangium carneum]